MLSYILIASFLLGGSLAANVKSEAHAKRADFSITEEDVVLLDRYSQYAAATYCNTNTPAGDSIVCYANCDEVLEDEGTIIKSFHTGAPPKSDIAGYVAVVPSRKEIIFAARGTKSNQNWLTNLNFAFVESLLVPGGKFHLGFYNAWVELSPGVHDAIDEAQAAYPGFRLKVVGHSLGGAIAAVAAAHLRSDGYELDLYTYGQPRVGNDIISNHITESGPLYRVTHYADPVPRLPLLVMDYRHTSPEIWLTGTPSDPKHWPLEDIKICQGNVSFDCNTNPFIPFNATDHGVYFGKMTCFNNETEEAVATMPEEIGNFIDEGKTEG